MEPFKVITKEHYSFLKQHSEFYVLEKIEADNGFIYLIGEKKLDGTFIDHGYFHSSHFEVV